MTARLPDAYFDRMYATADDPWQLSTRWYEQRKYAMTLALLPHTPVPARFRAGLLGRDADRATRAALRSRHGGRRRRGGAARRGRAAARGRLPGPGDADPLVVRCALASGPFDLLVLSEVAYYLQADALAATLRRECLRLEPGATVVAAHWRHPVADYPLTGDAAHDVIAHTPGLTSLGCYRDRDVVIEVFDAGEGRSVAAREELQEPSDVDK